jgi:hypothetical protein
MAVDGPIPHRRGCAARQLLTLQLLRMFEWFTRITEARHLDPPRPISSLVNRLSFIGDKENCGLALRQGMRRLKERDVKDHSGKVTSGR